MKAKEDKAEIVIDVCIWKNVGFDYDDGIEWKPSCYEKIPKHLKTLCSNQFYPEYNPKDDEFKFCPYCGGRLIVEDEDEEEEEK